MLHILKFILFPVITVLLSLTAAAQTLQLKQASNAKVLQSDEKLKSMFKDFSILQLPASPSFQLNAHEIALDIEGLPKLTFQGQNNEDLLKETTVITGPAASQRRKATPALHFNGRTPDGKNKLTLSVNSGFILGTFSVGNEQYYIEQLKNFLPDAGENQVILYKSSDVIAQNTTCGTPVANLNPARPNQLRQSANSTERMIDLALAIDASSVTVHNQDIDQTINYVSSVMNLVQEVYTYSFFDTLRFRITEFVVFAGSNTNFFIASDDINENLTKFQAWGATGFKKPYDLTGFWYYNKVFNTGTIGLAYLGNTCNSRGNHVIKEHGASLAIMRQLVAHEIGHNFNAQHDGQNARTIMEPSVSGSSSWSAQSVSQMNLWLDRAETGCITPPEITLTSNLPGTAVCQGNKVKYTARVDAVIGSNPFYQWKINSQLVGSNAAEFEPASIANGDTISCEFSSILSGERITYSSRRMVVQVVNADAPLLTSNKPATFCAGDSVIMIATGAGPFQWQKDGAVINNASANLLIVKQSGSYTVKSAINGCLSNPSTEVVATVQPSPVQPTVSFVNNSLQSSATTGNQWYFNGTAIQGATGQTYQPLANGLYTVQVSAAGCTSLMSANFSFVTTSINSPELEREMVIAPNPVLDNLFIRYPGNSRKMRVSILDISGRSMIAERSFTSSYQLNMKVLPAGTYFIKVINERTKEQLIKQVIKL